MQQDIETSVYTLRHRLNALKQEAHRIEERLKIATKELSDAADAERIAKQCYYLSRDINQFQSQSCSVRLANASGKASLAISKNIMLMAERAENLKAQNDLAVVIDQFEQAELRQHA